MKNGETGVKLREVDLRYLRKCTEIWKAFEDEHSIRRAFIGGEFESLVSRAHDGSRGCTLCIR
jgi:hypothetical protein